eukprot:GHVR01035414.1.p1 GENE.GHVR01035414.1~~GHVR01035414.1.p1  ORF type:complete len:255 (-),score=39.67 GHVR01035414.1:124-888(-)
MLRKLLCEFIGTYFFILCIILASSKSGLFLPVAVGMGLAVCVYTVGPISGGHLNPAVSLGVLLSGRGLMTIVDMVLYWVVQCIGGFLASVSAYYFKSSGLRLGHQYHSNTECIFAELIFTSFLVYTVLSVATTKAQAGNSYFALSIGMCVTVSAFSVGGISGGSFNPALVIGTLFCNFIFFPFNMEMLDIPIYIFSPLVGAAIAAGLFYLARMDTEYSVELEFEEEIYYTHTPDSHTLKRLTNAMNNNTDELNE